jgi:hypothetical protein
MGSLKAKIDNKARGVEQDVRSHLDDVKKHIEQDREKSKAAQANMKKWAEERKTTTSEKITEWKTKREISKLERRAEDAESYAAAAAVAAVAAVEEVELASLEAWLARVDAESAKGARAS